MFPPADRPTAPDVPTPCGEGQAAPAGHSHGEVPLIAVVGATATGKTAAGIALGRALGGEVVGADSRQVYRAMAIGTAQPSAGELAAVPHHLVGFLDPAAPFGLASWLDLARAATADIRARGRVPIVVGGTGQYVWALLEAWSVPRVAPDPELRRELEAYAAEHGPPALHERLSAVDPAAAQAIHPHNVRRVVRALEVFAHTGRRISEQQQRAPSDALVIGLALARPELYARIDRRVERMYAEGLLEEVRELAAHGYTRHLPSMGSIGYPEAWAVLAGEIPVADAVRGTQEATHRLARQQASWFRRADPRIRWLDANAPDVAGQAVALASEWLAAGTAGELPGGGRGGSADPDGEKRKSDQDALHEDARDG